MTLTSVGVEFRYWDTMVRFPWKLFASADSRVTMLPKQALLGIPSESSCLVELYRRGKKTQTSTEIKTPQVEISRVSRGHATVVIADLYEVDLLELSCLLVQIGHTLAQAGVSQSGLSEPMWRAQ